jgi:hypothetical protein
VANHIINHSSRVGWRAGAWLGGRLAKTLRRKGGLFTCIKWEIQSIGAYKERGRRIDGDRGIGSMGSGYVYGYLMVGRDGGERLGGVSLSVNNIII